MRREREREFEKESSERPCYFYNYFILKNTVSITAMRTVYEYHVYSSKIVAIATASRVILAVVVIVRQP